MTIFSFNILGIYTPLYCDIQWDHILTLMTASIWSVWEVNTVLSEQLPREIYGANSSDKHESEKGSRLWEVYSSFVAYYMTFQILTDWSIRVFQTHHITPILKPLWKNKTVLILVTLQMH